MYTATRLILLLVGLSLFAPRSTNAQTMSAGAKAGISFSSLPNVGAVMDQITGRTSVETSSNVGVVGGGFVEFGLRERWAFQPEMLFAMKGVKLNIASGGGTVTTRMNYLEFPLLVKYTTQAATRVVPYFMGGPSFGVKASTSAQLDTTSQTIDEEIDAAIRNVDIGATFVVGVRRGRFLIEARYTQGLSDVATDKYPHTDSLRNRTVAIVGGVHITK